MLSVIVDPGRHRFFSLLPIIAIISMSFFLLYDEGRERERERGRGPNLVEDSDFWHSKNVEVFMDPVINIDLCRRLFFPRVLYM